MAEESIVERLIACDEHRNVLPFDGAGVRAITLGCFYCWALTFALPLGYTDRAAITTLAKTIMYRGDAP